MGLKRKRIYILGLFCVFIIVIPLLILFSMGYRLDSKFRLVKTGGIYLENDESGVVVKLNGRVIEKSNMLEENILIRNLVPETYHVRLEKDGYKTWRKNIKVQEQKVTVCYPLLVQRVLHPEWIPKYHDNPGKKGRKRRELNEEYSEAMEIFKTYDKPPKDFISVWEDSDIKKYKLGAGRKLKKKVLLFRQGNRIYAQWTGNAESRPFFIDSANKKLVYYPANKIVSFGFFPGRSDSFLVLHDDGMLIAVEIDTRFGIHNVYRIVKNCTGFAVHDKVLYYISGKAVYKIDFES